VRGEPRGDRTRVALAGDPLGLLGGEPAVPQPRAERPRVEPDGELLVDQLGQTGGGPQFGGEPVLEGAAPQPPQDDLLLADAELAGPPPYRAAVRPPPPPV